MPLLTHTLQRMATFVCHYLKHTFLFFIIMMVNVCILYACGCVFRCARVWHVFYISIGINIQHGNLHKLWQQQLPIIYKCFRNYLSLSLYPSLFDLMLFSFVILGYFIENNCNSTYVLMRVNNCKFSCKDKNDKKQQKKKTKRKDYKKKKYNKILLLKLTT